MICPGWLAGHRHHGSRGASRKPGPSRRHRNGPPVFECGAQQTSPVSWATFS